MLRCPINAGLGQSRHQTGVKMNKDQEIEYLETKLTDYKQKAYFYEKKLEEIEKYLLKQTIKSINKKLEEIQRNKKIKNYIFQNKNLK